APGARTALRLRALRCALRASDQRRRQGRGLGRYASVRDQRVVDINALRALAPPPLRPVPRPSAPSPARRPPLEPAGTATALATIRHRVQRLLVRHGLEPGDDATGPADRLAEESPVLAGIVGAS